MPQENRLELVEIPGADRKGWSVERTREDEGVRMLAKVSASQQVIALDVNGRSISTETLAGKMGDWRMQGLDVAFLIGGADGLDSACLHRADETLSLSTFTFPHQLVRVILAEQLYRAWTILSGHPYHRA